MLRGIVRLGWLTVVAVLGAVYVGWWIMLLVDVGLIVAVVLGLL